jgi:2'-5' RNA ligase
LGDIQQSQVLTLSHQITRALRGLPPFRLEFGNVCPFPSKQRAHVIAIEIVYSQALQDLFKALEEGILATGFPAELRPARPHLTIARFRDRHIPAIELNLAANKIGMLVDKLTLYKSVLNSKGASYIALQQVLLAR